MPQTIMKQPKCCSGSLLRPLGAFAEMMWLAEHDGRKEQDADRSLVHLARHGDAQAFAMLVERHTPMVLKTIRRMLHHCEDAEDAAQELNERRSDKDREMSPSDIDDSLNESWESAHVCPSCEYVIPLADLDMGAVTTGIVSCPRCDWSGRIEIRVVNANRIKP
jgi:Sigma-70 region 2